MNNENISIRNLLRNLTKNQKLGIIVFLIIIAIIVAIVAGFVNNIQNDSPSNNEEETAKNSVPVSSGIKWSDTSDGNQEESERIEVPVSTEYNEEHEYTLIEYLPFARFAYKDYGYDQHGVRGYWIITENTAVEKGIVVSVDNCDVKGNTAAANEYLRNLPVDLSGYTVVYQTHIGNVPCDVE